MPSKILAAVIGLSLLSWATPTKAQQRSQPPIDVNLQQLPSQVEQLTQPSQVQEFQRLVEKQPLLNLFLELDQAELPNLQEKTEEQIRQILRQPPSLQEQLFQQQRRGTLKLDEL